MSIIKNKTNYHAFKITTAYDDHGWTEIDWSSPDFENLVESSFTEDNRDAALKRLNITPNMSTNSQLSDLVGKWFYAKAFQKSDGEYKIRPESIITEAQFKIANEAHSKSIREPTQTNIKQVSIKKPDAKVQYSKEDYAAWGRIGAAKKLDKVALKNTQEQIAKLLVRQRTLKSQCSANLFEAANLLQDIIKETLSSY